MSRFFLSYISALGAGDFTTTSTALSRTGDKEKSAIPNLCKVAGNFNGAAATFGFVSDLRASNRLEITDSSGQTRTLTLGLWAENSKGLPLNGRLFYDTASGRDYVLYYDDNELTAQSGWQIAQVTAGKLNPQTGRIQIVPYQPDSDSGGGVDILNGLPEGALDALWRIKITDKSLEETELTSAQRDFLNSLNDFLKKVQAGAGTKYEKYEAVLNFMKEHKDKLDAIAANKKAMLEVLQIFGENSEIKFPVFALGGLLSRMSFQDRNSLEFVTAVLAVWPHMIKNISPQIQNDAVGWDNKFYLEEFALLNLVHENLAYLDSLAVDSQCFLFKLLPAKELSAEAAKGSLNISRIIDSLTVCPHLLSDLEPEKKAVLLEWIKSDRCSLRLAGPEYLVLRSFLPEETAESFAGVTVSSENKTKEELDTLFQRCQNVGINCYERFDLETVEKLLFFREQPLDPNKPVALIIQTVRAGDYNGAFRDSRHITALLEQGYQVCYYEIGDEAEIPQTFANTYYCNNSEPNAEQTRKIDVIVFSGHGTNESLLLGNVPNPSAGQIVQYEVSRIVKYIEKEKKQKPDAEEVFSSVRDILDASGLKYSLDNSMTPPMFQLDCAELIKLPAEALSNLLRNLEEFSASFANNLRSCYENWRDYDRAHIDVTDAELIACNRYFSETGVLIANSCSNGYKKDINGDGLITVQDDTPENKNMVDAFHQWFSGGRRRFYGAPDIQYGAPQIYFKAGNITTVFYSLSGYGNYLPSAYYKSGEEVYGRLPVADKPLSPRPSPKWQ
ncbi:hypothetical protein NO1_0292 [Candidatus Termititenax aidoneus]|uniref:Uncharacterized protein n=1 Tax=Termititenax aidoneus TaxID=2218524 RepID=A0A388T9A9_TERA1|nr:hypothetical protein NO1_0292 [Candidatus Termititenax aidoneus]